MATLTNDAPPLMRPLGPLAPGKVRLDSVDILRGLVMVVMALDHTRDFLTYLTFSPEDLTQSGLALWITRWLTHFCAPAFFFLAGTGAFLSYSRGKTKAQLARFLWTRGLWLVVVEYTVVGFGWTFNFFGFGGVIWALGWCMVINAAIVRLPMRWIATLGGAMVLGHNLLDGIHSADLGRFAWLWHILHENGYFPLPFKHPPVLTGVFILYPLVPWIGVMSLGFVFGNVLLRAPEARQRWMLRAGSAMTAAFVVLRVFNLYGNPAHVWAAGPRFDATFHFQPTLAGTFMYLTDVEKYPPSLQFLLMTLGPALILMALFDKLRIQGPGLVNAVGRFFVVYGRVPMFYYVLHLYVIHLLAYVVARLTGQPAAWLIRAGFFTQSAPPGYGHHLPLIYLVWAIAVLILFYPCRWYMGVKQRRRDWWLSYL
jgi:uncharacterized membrane protein